MLSSIDRILLVVGDRAAAAERWQRLFDAVVIGEDSSSALKASRTTIQVGDSLVEFLQPAGDGPVTAFVERWGSGLYGVGFAVPDLVQAQRHFDSHEVSFVREGETLYLENTETDGMPAVIVPRADRQPVGILSHIYEVTNPVRDWQGTSAKYTRVFGLDALRFSPITSSAYGYTGTLTLFEPPARLDRIEVVQTGADGAMDRFFKKRGSSLYMCYAEASDVLALAERLKANGARYAASADAPLENGLFIHPSALDSMLMGVSRTNYAWTWSGRPDLAGRVGGAH